MADIKVKQKSDIKIKKLNKAEIYTQKLKSNIVNVKEKTNHTTNNDEESINEYGANQISETTNNVIHIGTDKFNKYGQESVVKTKENVENAIQKIKKKVNDRNIKKATKTLKRKTKRTIKNTPKTVKNTLKTTTKITKETVKGVKRAYQIAKATAKVTVKTIKLGIKATISAIKAIISATQALISFIVAGGWIAIVIIIIICLVAMLVSSVFGIFFSSEENGSTITVNDTTQSVTMNKVISDLNNEFINKITQIQQENTYDEYEINSQKAEWKDILAVYVAKVSNGNNEVEMMTLNDEKVNTLKEIFWEMNEITSSTETVKKQVEETDEQGNTTLVEKDITVLKITVTGKTASQMADQYGFNQAQRNQLAEFQKEEYASMWSAVIYGSSVGSNDIVEVARQQIGNVRSDNLIGVGMDLIQE